MTTKFHTFGEEIGTGEFGGAACAGAIVVVLNNLLQRYRIDLREVSPKWEGVGICYGGYSFGEVIDATANNFRHYDEWASTRKLGLRQKKSIHVIEAVLNYTAMSQVLTVPWRRNACADIIAVLSESKFTTLEHMLFEFIKAMAVS